MFTDEEFNNLVKTYMDTVFRLALNYVKCYQTAEDITQNVFIKLFHSNKSFESENHIRYWLIRVTINECKKILLSPWRKIVPIEEYMDTVSFPSQEHSDLFYAVMSLPKKYRVVIYLHYYEEYSTEEISKLLGVPSATVRTQLKRGRALLKSNLEGSHV
jgi:RNA polymerase sigma-70 factor (ECF subfamily)